MSKKKKWKALEKQKENLLHLLLWVPSQLQHLQWLHFYKRRLGKHTTTIFTHRPLYKENWFLLQLSCTWWADYASECQKQEDSYIEAWGEGLGIRGGGEDEEDKEDEEAWAGGRQKQRKAGAASDSWAPIHSAAARTERGGRYGEWHYHRAWPSLPP